MIEAMQNIVNENRRPLGMAKGERLHHRSLVNHLFEHGKSVSVSPLRAVWAMVEPADMQRYFRLGLPPKFERVQFMITIPKKKHRRAVRRVLLRRRVREAYRLNRKPLTAHFCQLFPDGRYLVMALLYTTPEVADYATIESSLKRIFEILDHKLEKRSGQSSTES